MKLDLEPSVEDFAVCGMTSRQSGTTTSSEMDGALRMRTSTTVVLPSNVALGACMQSMCKNCAAPFLLLYVRFQAEADVEFLLFIHLRVLP